MLFEFNKKIHTTSAHLVGNKLKDGGAHFDPNVPIKYDTFRHPNLFTVSFGGTVIPFSKNPVYVSVRQMAWEVLETIEKM